VAGETQPQGLDHRWNDDWYDWDHHHRKWHDDYWKHCGQHDWHDNWHLWAGDFVTLGSDTLDGGAGNDLMFGDSMALYAPILTVDSGVSKKDACWVRHEAGEILDELTELGGHYVHHGWFHHDATTQDGYQVTGGGDILTGGDGDDILFGQGGDDILNGGTDNDWLIGGDGKDLLDKGTGKDKASHGNDYSRDLGEKVQARLIDWIGESEDSHVPGNGTCHQAKVSPCAPWVKDFVIDFAGNNGTHNPNSEIKILIPGREDRKYSTDYKR